MQAHNRKVLLVDDQADFLAEIRAWLEPTHEVHLAHDGPQALAACREAGPFAVVVSDFAMPGMTGIELFGELRRRWPDTLRVMLTGMADLGLALEALEQGAIFRFLTKPPRRQRFLDAIGDAVACFGRQAEERLFTAQLTFVQESLQAFNETLGTRLDGAKGQLAALENQAGLLRDVRSLEQVLQRTTESLQRWLGERAPTVLGSAEGGVQVHHASGLSASEQRVVAILEASARLAADKVRGLAEREEGERTILRSLEALARYRDDETGEHLERVSAYARFLTERLARHPSHAAEIDTAFIEHMADAAPLHDIGKVAVPDSILFKPARLDSAEWAVMRTHAQVGADILATALQSSSGSGCLRVAHDLAGTHHERWDGSGYPRGLEGTEIPLAGRIMAVVDCYDALTSERVYKRAWTHEEAVEQIRAEKGGAYDPTIVDVFLEHEREIAQLMGVVRAQ
jgi:response regulator RpfG family c-di-GMP phosphodiesterase